MKTLLIHIPKTTIDDLGGFVFNLIVVIIIAVIGIILLISLPWLVKILEEWIITSTRPSVFWLLLIGPILLIFFNINESHFAMWVGIILTAIHLIIYVIIPDVIPYIRKLICKIKHKRKEK